MFFVTELRVNTGYKDIWKLAFPVIAGSIATTVLHVTDTAYLGRVSETALGAAALGGVFYFVFVMLGVSLSVGAQIIISRRAGENDKQSITEVFQNSTYILVSLGVLLYMISVFVAPPVLKNLIADNATAGATISFLKYRAIGLIPVLAALSFRSVFVGINRSKVWGIYSTIQAVVNVILAYILIFGKCGFDEMGVEGAGLASSISEIIGLIYLLCYTQWKKSMTEFKLFKFRKYDSSIGKEIIKLSSPLFFQNAISMGSWFIFFLVIEKYGSHALAIANLGRSAYIISMTPIWGFSVAANSMVSNLIGQDKKSEVLGLLKKLLVLSLSISSFFVLFNFIFPEMILSLFTSDVILIQDSFLCLRIVNCCVLLFSVSIVTLQALSGTGATKIALLIEVAAIVVYLLYVYVAAYIMRWPHEAVWLSEILYWLMMGTISIWYLRSGKWKNIRI